MVSTPTAPTDEVAALREKVAQLEAMQPKFVRQRPVRGDRPRTYEQPEAIRQQAMKRLAKGDSAGGTMRWLDTPQGRVTVPPEYRPVFAPGDLVRINPDAEIWGGSGKKWGDVLADPKVKAAEAGEVVCTMYMTETWEPKYKVQFAGLTHGSGDGFRESELLPYE